VEKGGEKFYIKKDGSRAAKKVKELKVAGWTDAGDRRFEELDGVEEWTMARDALVSHMREKGYKFDGNYHQSGAYGTPYFDNGKKFCIGLRRWGGLMAEVLELDDSDGMAYTDWAWSGGESKLPDPRDPDYQEYAAEQENLREKIIQTILQIKEQRYEGNTVLDIIDDAFTVYSIEHDREFKVEYGDNAQIIEIETSCEDVETAAQIVVQMWLDAQALSDSVLEGDYDAGDIEPTLLKALIRSKEEYKGDKTGIRFKR
jgi:hypothetical protein